MTLVGFSQLALMVFLLGLKHGIDPDHLAAIDGMTRFNALDKPRLSRWAGFLFSLGHGTVVTAFAAFLGAAATQRHVPHWTATVGALTSIAFLLGLGGLNLYGVLHANPASPYRPVGFKGTLLARFFRVRSPAAIVLVGVVFAISFDTLSQAALFAATTAQASSWQYAVVLALIFTGGMMLPDAVNGLWLSKLIRRANTHAQTASRIMGGVIALLSLTIGGINLARFAWPPFAAQADAYQLLISTSLILMAAAGFPAMVYLRRSRTVATPMVCGHTEPFGSGSPARENSSARNSAPR